MKNSQKYQALYAEDHIVYYPVYAYGTIMKWFSGIIFCIDLALFVVFAVNWNFMMFTLSLLGALVFAILWGMAHRIMYTKITVDHDGAMIENPRMKKAQSFLWSDVKEMKTTITRGLANLTFDFHDSEKKPCTMTITAAVDHKALYPYLPMERMAEKDRYMLDI